MVRNILALVDFSEMTNPVVEAAGELASVYDAKCWLIHIAAPDPEFVGYDVGPQYIRDSRATTLREEHRKLQELRDTLEKRKVSCEALLVMGSLYETIEQEVRKLEIDLIVLGSHGRSMLHELLVGSVCEFLLRHAKVPLLILPAQRKDSDPAPA